MVSKMGIHLPNGPLRDDRCFRLGVSNYMMLHLQAPEFAYRARQAALDGIIEIRFYLPFWSTADPLRWARFCAEDYLADRYGGSYSAIRCHVTPANEQNLVDEGGGSSAEWYGRINEWNLVWLGEFQRLTNCPIERIHFPAFAYGHSDDLPDNGYIGMEICRQAIEAYGVLDVHPYWFEPDQVLDPYRGHRFELAHVLFPDKPIFCSELGNFDVMRSSTPDEIVTWFQNLPDYLLGGTPFIWEDPTGAHSVNDWSRNPAIGERIAAQPKPQISPNTIPEEPAMPDYVFAFRDLHDSAPDVVGDATSEQFDIPGIMSIQFTSNGILVYRDGAGAKFIAQTLPKKA